MKDFSCDINNNGNHFHHIKKGSTFRDMWKGNL
jgi:hypothetical protein